ncbi:Protein wos2 [Psilocybe cubensis]|uniref:Protein wos2 n=1 Tax=Psilocybe cubensis TaxID=181762 RepID=A0ACB8HCX9_PSICU|nr:Protein wos2 [Psilocybe cubensis]KAH9485860.1 Protein wos2 [Psilocybe cubensis]
MTAVKMATILWAQRSSSIIKQKNVIYLTINIPGIIHSTVEYNVTETSFSLKAYAKEYQDEEVNEYQVAFDFYANVETQALIKQRTENSITFAILKRDLTLRYWPRLSNLALENVKMDFSRWTWEGDESDADDIDENCGTRRTWEADDPDDVSDPERTEMGYNGSTSEEASFFWVSNMIYILRKQQQVEECEQLGIFFVNRFISLQNRDDLNMAISKLNKAVNLTSDWQLEKPRRQHMLACAFAGRFENWGNMEDLAAAIEITEDALESLLFERRGDPIDIDRSISLLRHVVDHTSANDSELPNRLNNLGTSLFRRFERLGDLADVDSSIYQHQLAVELIHEGHQDFSGCHHSLGTSLLFRAERQGNFDDINLAIHHLTKSVEAGMLQQSNQAICLHNLGTSYTCRFQMRGDLADIDTAILHLQRSIQLTAADDPNLPGHFINLGVSLLCRFERTNILADVNSAINHYTKAVELTPAGHPNLGGRHSNLGNSYRYRLVALGDRKDADSSIFHLHKAVSLTAAGHAQLPRFLTNLGNSYMQRFHLFRDVADVEHAISYHKQAVDLTKSATDSGLPRRLKNLGRSYQSRFNHSSNIADIDVAISLFQQALDVTPHGHASLPESFHDLALSRQKRFQKTFDNTDINSALSHLCQGAEASGPPSSRFSCASTAAILSQSSNIVPNPSIYLFGLAISLLSEVAGLEQTIQRRHANLQLEDSAGFVPLGVTAAIDNGRPDLAVEWLEQGRCLVWNQIDKLRAPLDQLRNKDPVLADRFMLVAKTLDTLGPRSETNNMASSIEDDIRWQDQILLHTRTAENYKEVLREVRDLPGLEDFLQPAKATSLLASLPPDSAVILFSIGTDRCNALALTGGLDQPLYIPLDNFDDELARSLQGTLQDDIHNHRTARDLNRGAIDHVDSSIVLTLEVIWYKIVKPILDALKYTIPLNRADRPRIWWCPSGPLSFLPLHAAGLYSSQNPTCVSDYVVSSYTPTVRSLIEKFQASKSPSPSRSKSGLLLISQPNTPGLPAIPSTIRETKSLKAMMDKHGVRTLLLEHDEATREKVKEALNSYSWVHFACHGVQDAKEPLESGLCLHDGRMDLLEIMKERVQEPQLAFLSACQTSTGDFALSEEVVHLAAGMLAAGYRGVVGTMWSISDEHGPLFAEEFYRMGPNGLDGSLAAYALDHATSVVRQNLGKSEHGLLKWVPYVHFGY